MGSLAGLAAMQVGNRRRREDRYPFPAFLPPADRAGKHADELVTALGGRNIPAYRLRRLNQETGMRGLTVLLRNQQPRAVTAAACVRNHRATHFDRPPLVLVQVLQYIADLVRLCLDGHGGEAAHQ
jgi:hypothetical protein